VSTGVAGKPLSIDAEAAWRQAEGAARQAGVEVRLLGAELAEFADVEALAERIWGPGLTVVLLRSFAATGNYVAGAWIHDRLIGAAVGFVEGTPGVRSLHLLLAGVAPPAQGSGVGFALTCHQRAWAVGQRIGQITWMFDPLGRRNAWFSLVKIGGTADAYYPNFFGYLNDPINRWDDTDRCRARWDLVAPFPPPEGRATLDAAALSEAGAIPVLRQAPDGSARVEPVGELGEGAAATLLCELPNDLAALRRADPELARGWRPALRAVMSTAMAAGYVATSFTRDGWYVLQRRAR
jgi:predicted GNAT superfamily acetyltransferase